MVNLYHILDLGQTSARLTNGSEIPIGRRARAEVLEAYRRWRRIWDGEVPRGAGGDGIGAVHRDM